MLKRVRDYAAVLGDGNITKEIAKIALEKLEISGVDVEISKPAQAENGDFSSNIAMKLAKSLRKNPMEIADMIAKNIDNENIKSIEIKAPGFINFFVSKAVSYTHLTLPTTERV